MALALTTCSRQRTDRNILEINQELLSQLAQSKQQVRDLKEKFLISEATAYTLANQLQKYKCEEYKDLIESVLREELQFEEERPVARIGLSSSDI
ncbi:putative neuroblastoma breakpoint family member 5 [Loxodonta africana]|uniref:putative neuroblastoma breakpoint family member 5 n=1 Tax=Loxodonta africana TaxID=9785 RepID=UPI0030D28100